MDAASSACASSGMTWDGINWSKVLRQVRGLQARIVKATQEGRHNKVKALQWLLTHSFSGKALAVKRVTGNKGKNIPGVDKITWKTPDAKINAIASMKRRGYSALPLRKSINSEEKWQDKTAWHTCNEVPRHASVTFAGVGTRC